jgi:hypothetical protein
VDIARVRYRIEPLTNPSRRSQRISKNC